MTFHVAGTVLDYSDAAGREPDWSAAHPLDGVTVTPAALAEILRLHRLWADSSGGGRRADLTGAVLTRAVLTGADLSDAHLHRAVLTGADLTGACLSGANLSEADLTRAILSEANLSDAILTRAILTRAILTGARYVREAEE